MLKLIPVSRHLITAAAVQVLCQIYKVVFYSLRDGKIQLHYFTTAGGMPSSHAAFVTALTTSIGLAQGIGSEIFAVSFVFSAIIVFDAFRLRGTVEVHSHVLQKLLAILPQTESMQIAKGIKIPQMVGHTIGEIAAGILVGVVFANLAHIIYLS